MSDQSDLKQILIKTIESNLLKEEGELNMSPENAALMYQNIILAEKLDKIIFLLENKKCSKQALNMVYPQKSKGQVIKKGL